MFLARHLVRVLLVACLSMPLAGAADKENKLPDEVQKALGKAKDFELWSLDPSVRGEKVNAFHGWKVLGKATVKADDRKKVVDALNKGIKANDGIVAACFNPRHGIRVTADDGKAFDLVICFQCYSMQVFQDKDEKVIASVLTTGSPQPTFDGVLKAANVKLAPKDD